MEVSRAERRGHDETQTSALGQLLGSALEKPGISKKRFACPQEKEKIKKIQGGPLLFTPVRVSDYLARPARQPPLFNHVWAGVNVLSAQRYI